MCTLIKDNILENLGNIMHSNAKNFSKGDKIIVKAHLGEYGNLNYVRPPIIECIISELKKSGMKPVIFDTPSWYDGRRHSAKDYLDTARKNGFTKETMGCPIIISDDSIAVKGKKHMDIVNLAKEIYHADGMIVVSHFKGHMCASFGGAIKNLGMGAVNAETKKAMHVMSQPGVTGECKGCKTCESVCRVGAISVENNIAHIDNDSCYGCCVCTLKCPNNAISGDIGLIQKFLAESSACVLDNYDKKKLIFVNVLQNISALCDCATDFGNIICPDIGVVVSDNIVKADKCSLDLANKATGCDIFKKTNYLDPYIQIEAAIEYGLGSGEYKLHELS